MTDKIELNKFKTLLASGTLTRRQVQKALAAVGVVTVSVPLVRKPAFAETEIEVFTWEVYARPELERSYIEEYGAAPSHVFFADNDEAFLKMRAGYLPSVIQPTSVAVPRLRDAGMLAPIDTSKLSNYGDIFQPLKDIDVMSQGGNVYAVPLSWGNSSVLYRKDLAPEYVDNNTWGILWDPKFDGQLAQNGIMDAPVLQAALLLGIEDPYQISDADIERVRQKLVEQRSLLRFYWTTQTELTQAVASGEIVAANTWNDAYAQLKREGVDVGYMTPKEGILTWVDTTCLIKDGPGSEDEALAYIDASISPEAGKFFIEEYGYGAPNRETYKIADPELLVELGIEDPAKALSLGVFFKEFTPELREKLVNMFEEVKAGF